MAETTLSAELKTYAANVAQEWCLCASSITPAMLGKVLKEAMARMDRAALAMMDSRAAQRALAEEIWMECRAA